MDWSDWQPTYLDIVQRLELNTSKDREATVLLTELLEHVNPQPLLDQLRESIDGKNVVVCGAGPSLEQHVQILKADDTFVDYVVVAADGAVSFLLEQDVGCDVVATDLDGSLEHLMKIQRKGAILIVHGHGDNMEIVRSVVPKLGEVLGSTQVEPTHRTFLWGGFTDGDRACHIVSNYNPKRIILAGMDFGNIVGKWSKPGHDDHFSASRRKKIKLEIAEELISELLESTGIDYYYLNSIEGR